MAQQVKAGDVVHVRAVVIQEIEGGNSLLIGCNETSQYENTSARAVVSRDTIVHVEPRALQVGDKVRDSEGDVAEIVAIRRDEVWIDYGPNKISCLTLDLETVSGMERV